MLKDGLALREESKKSRAEVVSQLKSAEPDSAKLHALIDERSKAMTEFAHKVADAAVEAHKALTPAQREKLNKKIERHLNRWE